jgi:hypothetical protein
MGTVEFDVGSGGSTSIGSCTIVPGAAFKVAYLI